MRRYWNRPLGSKLILLGAIAFLVSMLGPWTRVCVATATVAARKCGWTTGYEGSDFGIYAALFAVAILVFELLPVLWPRLSMRGWPTAVITAILGVGLALCTLVKRRARAARRGYPVGTTYGGDQVSTWSVLRSSSEPRSPVGLVNPPAQKQVRRTISHSPPSKH